MTSAVPEKINSPLLGWLILLITIVGIDWFGIQLSGANIRLSQPVYFAVFLCLLHKIRIDISLLTLILLFFLLAVPSIYLSHNYPKSLMYVVWIFFNFFVMVGVFSYYSEFYRDTLYKALLYSCRLQIVLGLLLVIAGIQNRAELLYYEPAQFSVSLVVYLGIIMARVLSQGYKGSILDFFLILTAIATTQSATLLLAIGILFLVVMIYKILNGMSFRWLITMLSILSGIVFMAWLYSYLSPDDLLGRTLTWVLEDPSEFLHIIDLRAGNRVPRIECAWDVFRAQWPTGVGLGGYDYYLNTIDVSQYSGGVVWREVEGLPPENIYVEMLASSGVFAGTLFIALFVVTVVKYWANRDVIDLSYFLALVTMLLTLNLGANCLRPYLWMLIGVYIGNKRSLINQARSS